MVSGDRRIDLLIRTEDLHTSKRFNSAKLLDNSFLLGKISSTNSHGSGDDSLINQQRNSIGTYRKTNGHTNNCDGQSIFEKDNNAVRSVERAFS